MRRTAGRSPGVGGGGGLGVNQSAALAPPWRRLEEVVMGVAALEPPFFVVFSAALASRAAARDSSGDVPLSRSARRMS